MSDITTPDEPQVGDTGPSQVTEQPETASGSLSVSGDGDIAGDDDSSPASAEYNGPDAAEFSSPLDADGPDPDPGVDPAQYNRI